MHRRPPAGRRWKRSGRPRYSARMVLVKIQAHALRCAATRAEKSDRPCDFLRRTRRWSSGGGRRGNSAPALFRARDLAPRERAIDSAHRPARYAQSTPRPAAAQDDDPDRRGHDQHGPPARCALVLTGGGVRPHDQDGVLGAGAAHLVAHSSCSFFSAFSAFFFLSSSALMRVTIVRALLRFSLWSSAS